MKFAHISDMHLLAEGAMINDVNPKKHLEKVLKDILKHHPKIKFVTMTGDLTQNGDLDAYETLAKIIKNYPVPIFPIIGNHDIRKNFWKFFPKYKSGKYVQYTKVFNDRVFLFLDSVKEGVHSGHMNKERFMWLEEKLKKYKKKDIYLVMHHHPVFVDMPPMDNLYNFKSASKFWKIVAKYPNVKHIFFGHLHRNFDGRHKGVGLSSVNSTSFQIAYTPDEQQEFLILDEPPTYSIIEIKKHTFKIHTITFLKDHNKKLL